MATKKFRYYAEHDGHTFTRISAREYSHCVIEMVVFAQVLEHRAEHARVHWWPNRKARMEAAVAGQPCWPGCSTERPYTAEEIEEYKKELAAGAEPFVADQVEELRIEIKHKYGDAEYTYQLVGFCGRLDLAQKLKDAAFDHRTVLPVSIR